MVVNSSTTPIIAAKILAASPLSCEAKMNTIVESTPEVKLTLIGVPNLAENVPSQRGPQPS